MCDPVLANAGAIHAYIVYEAWKAYLLPHTRSTLTA